MQVVTRDVYLIFYGPGQIGEVDTEQAAQELADRFLAALRNIDIPITRDIRIIKREWTTAV